MGFNFGGAVIDFDFRSAIGELPEDRAAFRHGGESPDELEVKESTDAGLLALEELGFRVNPADSTLGFEDASSRDFDDFAYARVNGKTLLLGRNIGLGQGESVAEASAMSARRGAVLMFWFNDASGTYQFSLFRGGARIRFWSEGEGMSDDEGAPIGMEAAHAHGFDRTLAVLEQFLGASLGDLHPVTFERFNRL